MFHRYCNNVEIYVVLCLNKNNVIVNNWKYVLSWTFNLYMYCNRRCALVHWLSLPSGCHVHYGPRGPTKGPFYQLCPRDFGPPHRAAVLRSLEEQVPSAWQTADLLVRLSHESFTLFGKLYFCMSIDFYRFIQNFLEYKISFKNISLLLKKKCKNCTGELLLVNATACMKATFNSLQIFVITLFKIL